MNQDEAERCLDIGRESEDRGDYDRAFKFYTKSASLYPTEAALNALRNLDGLRKRARNNNSNSSSSNESESYSSRSSPNENVTNEQRNYTKEQVHAVERIRKCVDYYEILEISKDADDTEIKKKYKKIALQMHPDKNRAPGAEEAFKKIGQAFSCLNDSSKRRLYDLRGTESDIPTTRSPNGSYRHAYEGDLTPEEIFSMFFGGVPLNRTRGGNTQSQFRYNFGGQSPFVQRQRHRPQQPQESQSLMQTCFQLLPLILILLLSLFSGNSRDPLYSFQRNNQYSVQQKTSNLYYDIQYYVKPGFDLSQYTNLEQEIAENWIRKTKENCYYEYQQWSRTARYYGEEYANTHVKRTSCKILQDKGIPV